LHWGYMQWTQKATQKGTLCYIGALCNQLLLKSLWSHFVTRRYFARVRRVAPALARASDGHRVLCFSHAASTALVAALLDTPNLNKDVGAFAPCGVFHLVADGACVVYG
jgi:hypothetical protein